MLGSRIQWNVMPSDLTGVVAGPDQVRAQSLAANAGQALDDGAMLRADRAAPHRPLPDQPLGALESLSRGRLATHSVYGVCDQVQVIHGHTIARLSLPDNSPAVLTDER